MNSKSTGCSTYIFIEMKILKLRPQSYYWTFICYPCNFINGLRKGQNYWEHASHYFFVTQDLKKNFVHLQKLTKSLESHKLSFLCEASSYPEILEFYVVPAQFYAKVMALVLHDLVS